MREIFLQESRTIILLSELGGAIVSITLVMMSVFIPVSFMVPRFF